MSPEQALGEDVTPQSDLYSLGILLFIALTGISPFPGATTAEEVMRAHIDEPPLSLAAARPDRNVPANAEALVAWALEKDRARRVPSAAAFAAALAALDSATVPSGQRWSAMRAPRDPGRCPGSGEEVVDPESATLPLRDGTLPAPTRGSVGDSVIESRVRPLEPAAFTIPGRARISVPAGRSIDGFEVVYATAARVLRIGRSRPDQSAAAAENTLVVRVLPCRSERDDPENYRATQGISSSHVTIAAGGEGLVVTDHGRLGTHVDGRALVPGEPTPLPARFELRLGDAITLGGRYFGPAPGALLLLRRANLTRMGYLWVIGRAEIGTGEGAALRLHDGAGWIARDGDALRMVLPAGLAANSSEVGE